MKALKAMDCEVEKTHGGQYGTAGRADIYVLVPVAYALYPVPVYLEVKQPGKKSTPLQKAWAAKKRKVGAIVEEVHNVEEAVEVILQVVWSTYHYVEE